MAGVCVGDALAGDPVFVAATGSPFAVDTSPFSVAVADVNGDGKPDLVTANIYANPGDVSVLLGNGSGGFTAASGSPFPAGVDPISVAVADFNGDGKPDLAVANYSSTTVTVLVGDGSGGFAEEASSPFTVGNTPRSVVAADVNGDGNEDLVVSCESNVTVLLGDGAGGFAPAAGSPLPGGGYSVAVADLNGDAKLDLALATSGSPGSVWVLLGDGVGGFSNAPGSPFHVGSSPESVVVADFNGDGAPDLATANLGSNDVTVLLANGAGGFAAAPGSPIAVGGRPDSIAAADLNVDGNPDLVVANAGGYGTGYSGVTVLVGDGTGGFTGATGSPYPAGTTPGSVAIGDVNGDGKPDVAVSNLDSNNVTVLLNKTRLGPVVVSTDAEPSSGKSGTQITLHSHATDSKGLTDVYYNLFSHGGVFVCNLADVTIAGAPTDYTDPGTTVSKAIPFAGLDTGVGHPCPAQGVAPGSYVVAANWVDAAGYQVGAPDEQNLSNYPAAAKFSPLVYVVAASVTVGLNPPSIAADGTATSVATATVRDTVGDPVRGEIITFTSTDPGEQVGAVTDNGDGTYSATITASTTPGTPTITATDTSVSPKVSGQAMLKQSIVKPTVGAISPSTGPTSGGTAITITGTGFVTGASVLIGQGNGTAGAIPATDVQVLSSTQITATTGGGARPGAWNLFVANSGATSATNANAKFTYFPTVTAVSPTSGPTGGGTQITITGSGFVSGASVWIGQGNGTAGAIRATNVQVVSPTKITATTGGGALAGTWNVFVVSLGVTSPINPNATFDYFSLNVTGVAPASGPASGGTAVTITGTGFAAGATVLIGQGNGTNGAIPASNVVVVSSTKIKATTGGGARAGNWNVFVVSSGVTSPISANAKFSYFPTVTAVSPASGPVAGGTSITITGSGFVAGASVLIGQGNGTTGAITASNIHVVSSTKITATTGGGARPGTWNAFVVSAGITSPISPGGRFTYG
jgi:hypothetical protein